MKVLHLVSEKIWRGGEEGLANLMDGLEKIGVENIVACPESSAFEKYCVEKKISFHTLPFSNHFDLISSFGLRKISKRIGADVIHIHSSRAQNVALFSSFFGKMPPMVLSRKVVFPVKQNFFSKWKYNSSKIKFIICISEIARKEMLKVVVDSEKCVAIHDGIDITKFSKAENKSILKSKFNISNDCKLAGIVAALSREKDHFTFIDAAENVLKEIKEVRFIIIGDGQLFQTIKEYILKKNLADKIFMTGFIKNIPDVLQELDVLVLTSLQEGFGVNIVEAFASKTPVVATNSGGVAEIVFNNRTGILCEKRNYLQIAEGIKKILLDNSLRKQLTENAFDFCLKNFSKEKMAEKTLEIYKKAMKGN